MRTKDAQEFPIAEGIGITLRGYAAANPRFQFCVETFLRGEQVGEFLQVFGGVYLGRPDPRTPPGCSAYALYSKHQMFHPWVRWPDWEASPVLPTLGEWQVCLAASVATVVSRVTVKRLAKDYVGEGKLLPDWEYVEAYSKHYAGIVPALWEAIQTNVKFT